VSEIINGVSAKDQKPTQRERIIAGMIDAANRDGYGGANVSKVIAHAGVSRPTFYEYFSDKHDCFVATNREIAVRLLAHIRDAVAEVPPEQALQAAMRRLLTRVEAQPQQASFLANATMGGGPRALDERDRTILAIERIVEDTRAKTPAHVPSPDLPTRAVIGATHWLLLSRLRRGQRDFKEFADELVALIESYNVPYGAHRWKTPVPGPAPPPSSIAEELALCAPRALPPGRSKLSSAEVARNQRERIMYATAEVAARKGYTATTITDIASEAHVDRRVYYSHFRDKQEAFLAIHEFALHQLLAYGTRAYFSASTWPEQIWQGLLAGSQFQAMHPTIARISYVEAYAVGQPAIQRVEDSHRAFKIFLHEGNRQAKHPPSETATEAIVAAVFELGYQQTRSGHAEHLPCLAYPAAYITLAPYLGTHTANQIIDTKLRENTKLSPATRE
jgi:AcrR family transcriptional regulator